MKISEKNESAAVGRVPQPGERAVAKARPDRVSVDDARHAAEMVSAARMQAGEARVARLKQIETTVRAGHYRPSASRIADQILAAAELDARLRAAIEG